MQSLSKFCLFNLFKNFGLPLPMPSQTSASTPSTWSCGEHRDAGDGTSVDVGDAHSGDLHGDVPRLPLSDDGLSTRTGLCVGDVAGEISWMQGDAAWAGEGAGSRGGDVSSRIAWLRTNTLDLVLF